MSKATGWGIGLLAAAALCGLLNVAGAYADDGKVAMGILAGALLFISILCFANGAPKPTASHRETIPQQSQQQVSAPQTKAQPPAQPQQRTGDEPMSEPIDRDAALDVMAKMLGQKRVQDTPPVPQIPLFSPQETKQMVSYFRTQPDYVDEKTLHIFLQKASRQTKPQGQTWEQTKAVMQKVLEEASHEAHKDDTSIGSPIEQYGARIRVSNIDRHSGLYVLGVQGTGKSSFLEGLIFQDLWHGFPVIVIDPHGDVVDHVIAMIPNERMKDTYLLDMEDEAYPFGVNVFSGKQHQTAIAEAQAVDRVMHIFTALWGEMLLSQRSLPLYLRLATLVLFANPGSTLVDMYYFLTNEQLREKMLRNVTSRDIVQFWQEYGNMSKSARAKDIDPLIYRLQALFMGRSLISNIVGQSQSTIDFRKAIENKEIILIKLPTKILPQDAALIGTMLVAQIHAAIFSFADTSQEKRPGFSFFVDEFQHFVTMDFVEMFTEGRKFGSRLCLAHQLRGQLRGEVGDIVKAATKSAYTKIVFRTTDEDAHDIAEYYISTGATVRKEDIEPHPVKYLLTYGHKDATVTRFIEQYLRPVSLMTKRFEIAHWEEPFGMAELSTGLVLSVFGYFLKPQERPVVDNPLPYLDPFLYDVQVKQDPALPIPFEVLLGFSDCGNSFYQLLENAKQEAIFDFLEDPNAWKKYESKKPQQKEVLNFLYLLRTTTAILAKDPLGEKRTETKAEVVQRIIQLENRQALARIGTVVRHIRTLDMPANVFDLPPSGLMKRRSVIKDQTRAKYCRPRAVVESEPMQRLGAKEYEVAETGDATSSVAGAKPEPVAQREPQEQTPASMDNMNTLYAHLKAREIDPDTTILAALGEHYVLTIKQWMKLFAWGSYPRATQYFKELKDNDMIYRKDREGRGGTLVEGDWFFLLTKGANELVKRKQPAPLFRLEPNEAEKSSGDTLVHTYLVNELLIHLRLLERAQPDTIRIEQIDHERSMRRYYLAALADSKLYPDGFLRLLVPTPNGLKRRYSFLELQHTTQRDEANWKTKCRKYLELFDQADVLDKFFSTKAPQVLVITMEAAYIAYHKQWTEEVLAERGDRGRAYGNRFLIGAYDAGISDMTIPPEQFFCAPRFSTPFQSTPHAVFST